MSQLITAKQGGISVEVHSGGRLAPRTLALGEKVVVDNLNSQLERMRDAGMLSIRKATPGEVAKYEKLLIS